MLLDEQIQQHLINLSPSIKAEVFDFILFLEQKQKMMGVKKTVSNSQGLKDSLNKAVALNLLTGVDGVKWQQEQRQDNVLFGRED